MQKPSIITVLSGKGGVGKTIISANLASVIAEDYNVLLIDSDYYIRSLTYILTGFVERITKSKKEIDWGKVFLQSPNTYNDEFREKVKDAFINIEDYIINVDDYIVRQRKDEDRGLIGLLPSYYDRLRPFDWTLKSVSYLKLFDRISSFFEISIDKISDRYRFIIIDTHAGLIDFNIISCLKSDYSIIVTEEDFLSMDANLYLISLIKRLYREERPNSNFRYFLALNKINERENRPSLRLLINPLRSNNISFVCRNRPKIKEMCDSKSFTFIPEKITDITENEKEIDSYKEFRYALLHLWKKIAFSEKDIELNPSQKEEIEEDILDY